MRIVCFGDSNTWGFDPRSYFGERYDAPWPELLAGMTGWTVVNAGLNGREIPRHPVSFPAEADWVLVMLGTNDLLQGASAREAAARMDAFLPRQGPVVLIAPPPMKRGAWVPSDELVKEALFLADYYAALARKRNIPFIDTCGWNIPLAFDGVHFTEDGHREFAQRIHHALKIAP